MSRLGIAATAAGTAVAASAAFDLLFHLAAGAGAEPGYVAVYLGFGALAALAVAGAASLTPAPARLALALLAAAHGALIGAGPEAVAIALATFLALPEPSNARRASRLGLVVALALGAAFVVAVRAERRLDLGLDPALVRTAAYLACLAPGAVAARLGSRARRAIAPVAVGSLALLAALPLWTARSRRDRDPPHYPPASADAGPHVVLLVLDTVGASQVSLAGEGPPTTPFLRSLLAPEGRAVSYPLAHSTSTWTAPAHASLFAGTLPSDHGVHEGTIYAGGKIAPPVLRAEHTLAELLRERGWRTACIFANSWLQAIPGLDRGFDWYVKPIGLLPFELLGEELRGRYAPLAFPAAAASGVGAERVNQAILRFFDACEPGPCFVVANYVDAHAPYTPGAETLGRFAPADGAWPVMAPTRHHPVETRELLLARHREEILELDAAVGRLVSALDARGILGRSWLIVTSDHGEAFGEHGATEHGTTVHGEVTRIPLLVRPPGGEVLEPYAGAVSLLDVTATVAAIAGAVAPGPGRDLRGLGAEPGPVLIEFFGNPRKAELHGPLAAEPARAVVLGDAKLIEGAGRRELYRLGPDPGEGRDVSGESREEVERLSALLPPLRSAEAAPRRSLSFEDERALRELGYVE
jgi:arylsulfatase